MAGGSGSVLFHPNENTTDGRTIDVTTKGLVDAQGNVDRASRLISVEQPTRAQNIGQQILEGMRILLSHLVP